MAVMRVQSDLKIPRIFLDPYYLIYDQVTPTGVSDLRSSLRPFSSLAYSSMTQRREAQHTSLDSLRDKLLKYHDQVIERKINERKKENSALHKRLENYEAHISGRVHRERQKKRKDEEETRMRTLEACQKKELLKRIDHDEKLRSELLSENDHLQKVEEMMRKYGTIEARRTILTKPAPKSDNSNLADKNQVLFLFRRKGSEVCDGLLSIDNCLATTTYRNVKVIRAPSANLGVAGARALSQTLSRGVCPELKELHLAWNAIGDGGLAYLLETFSLNNSPKLHHLDLTGNGITSDGIRVLKKVAMAKKKTKALAGLKYLCLRRNPIKADGAKILAHMLLTGWLWPTLEVLDISSSEIGFAGLKALRSALSSEALTTRLAPMLQRVIARDNCASAPREAFWPNILQI